MGVIDDTQSTRRRRLAPTEGVPLLLPVGNGNEDNSSNGVSPTESSQSKRDVYKSRRRRKRRSSKRNKDEPPFWAIVFQVGTTLMVVCLLSFHLYQWLWPRTESSDPYRGYDDDDGGIQVADAGGESYKSEQEAKLAEILRKSSEKEVNNVLQEIQKQENEIAAQPKTRPPLPVFDLSEAARYDAFEIIQELNVTADYHRTPQNANFWRAAEGLKRRFAETYGGENAARMLLDKGLSTFATDKLVTVHTPNSQISIPSDIIHTTCRLKNAHEEKRPFFVAFGGYSVTAGRGNYFSQSFPFVMEQLLHTSFLMAGIELKVRNAAIGMNASLILFSRLYVVTNLSKQSRAAHHSFAGGIPSFPYGWCFRNFLGNDPDIISYDYSMNEAGGVPQGLEAYIRHALTQFDQMKRPKLIVKDTYMASQRRELVSRYMEHLKDPVIVHTDPAAQPFLSRDEEDRPSGFQQWRKFGAPFGAPGQALHHPAVKEHELIAWILTMHILTALQLFVLSTAENLSLPCETQERVSPLPPPFSGDLTNSSHLEYPSVLFGVPGEIETHSWSMNPIYCRTSFQPILQGNLSSLIVDGTAAEEVELLLPKSLMYYNRGWTMDLSEGEKAAKRKLSLYENLGFIDGKQAYYGIFNSGTMRMLIPHESTIMGTGEVSEKSNFTLPKVGDAAKDWFHKVVVCQVNEKRDAGSCNSALDIGYRLGGIDTNGTLMTDVGTLYLGKKLCTVLSVPDGAKLTSRREMKKINGAQDYDLSKQASEQDQVGLPVDIFVTNRRIVHVNQACSVSHVIWEEQPTTPIMRKIR